MSPNFSKSELKRLAITYDCIDDRKMHYQLIQFLKQNIKEPKSAGKAVSLLIDTLIQVISETFGTYSFDGVA